MIQRCISRNLPFLQTFQSGLNPSSSVDCSTLQLVIHVFDSWLVIALSDWFDWSTLSLLQLEKFKTEAEKLRRRLEVAEEEHKIGAVQAEPVLTSANMDVDQIEEQSKEQTVVL